MVPKRTQNNGKRFVSLVTSCIKNYFQFSIKPTSIAPEETIEVNQPTYTERSPKSFGSDSTTFTESICKKAESENLSLEQLQQTLRNIQVITLNAYFYYTYTLVVLSDILLIFLGGIRRDKSIDSDSAEYIPWKRYA